MELEAVNVQVNFGVIWYFVYGIFFYLVDNRKCCTLTLKLTSII